MLVIGIAGTVLEAVEREWLRHPSVVGVILFTRNFASREQMTELAAEIRAAAICPQLLCVDQEGGRVQRFRNGFAELPALEGFDAMYRRDADAALALAEEHAWLMASEIRALDVDLSFAPVVDLGRGNRAIGDRAFSPDPAVVAALARAYVRGMHAAGMAATLKHFPGHGSVLEDTHHDAAIDTRPLETIRAEDLVPFAAGIGAGAEAMMLAHVTYPAVAPEPAGYSLRWINDILRREMGFEGVVFSDDIGMAAAELAGGVGARIAAHLDAGCDAVLVCSPQLVPDALATLFGRGRMDWDALQSHPRHARALARVTDHALA
jgi:beta-N-acetylhexosaminidase